ncbi:anhydro-N-acetylmuramic acid kinase [Govanella unica]|uniref:Anhydro-N-acetylmuramic acid kinase n=1 Tax=Govanella unica TaxID=2975056 RepID=A0A9X3TXS6_9PROT|nr:anhydro-N-acetylmuramic acid kinase [Govania unica]MDA5193554.1 anhydro-N-acetylmuramic acid kinase [Govania unica]
MDRKVFTAIGLMSGTSMDGIDVALLETDGEHITRLGPAETYAYDDATRERIRDAVRLAASLPPSFKIPDALDDAGRLMADRHAAAVLKFLVTNGIDRHQVDVIGFHGQTLRHAPELGLTWQVGDAQRLADLTGIRVVADFRRADVAAGGEGAPLAPLYHAALLRSAEGLGQRRPAVWPVAVLNLGGVGNVTWVEKPENPEILAFDTGPGNALIDDWVLAGSGARCDLGGELAAAGRVDDSLLAEWMRHPYFSQNAPKSLDRDAFAQCRPEGATLEDGAATLTAFTAASVAEASRQFPQAAAEWIVCGGGRHNPALMQALRERLGVTVKPVDVYGWRGDSLEAEAFGFLAVRALYGMPLSLPSTTRVKTPQPGGRIFHVMG